MPTIFFVSYFTTAHLFPSVYANLNISQIKACVCGWRKEVARENCMIFYCLRTVVIRLTRRPDVPIFLLIRHNPEHIPFSKSLYYGRVWKFCYHVRGWSVGKLSREYKNNENRQKQALLKTNMRNVVGSFLIIFFLRSNKNFLR